MYSTCIFCHSALAGSVPGLGIVHGDVVAFDPAKGRVWIVCRGCRGWNLLPLEDRWAVVEGAEELFRGAGQRVVGEHIAWAHLPDGAELVRIGKASLPEFVAWRYGTELLRRRGRVLQRLWSWHSRRRDYIRANRPTGPYKLGAVAIPAGLAAVAFPPVAGYAALTAGVSLLGAVEWSRWAIDDLKEKFRIEEEQRPLGTVLSEEGEGVLVTAQMARSARLDQSKAGDCVLVAYHANNARATLSGAQMRRALRLSLPVINMSGASKRDVQSAVGAIARAGGPDEFLSAAFNDQRLRLRRYDTLAVLPPMHRSALEIATNEIQERAGIEGEMWLLEEEWRQAEEIAAIADSLIPATIHTRFVNLVRQHGS